MSDTIERENVVTLQGNPVTLLGPDLAVGASAPDFKVVDSGFAPVHLSDFRGKTVLISAVPSLDTGVCALQTKRFSEEAAALPEGVEVLTISMDLPFAQSRFCEAQKVDGIKVLSDHVWHSFGEAYGVMIKGMGLLARSVWVVDSDGRIAYREVVPEVTDHPDYEAALAAVR